MSPGRKLLLLCGVSAIIVVAGGAYGAYRLALHDIRAHVLSTSYLTVAEYEAEFHPVLLRVTVGAYSLPALSFGLQSGEEVTPAVIHWNLGGFRNVWLAFG